MTDDSRLLTEEHQSQGWRRNPVNSYEMRAFAVVMPPAQYDQWWIARIKSRCTITSTGCWLWTGFKSRNGYGESTYRSRRTFIHRKMLELTQGIKLARLEYACHSCDVKLCCNPEHIWKGDNRLNKKDETAKGKNYWANKTHCPRGHEYTPENTYPYECRPGVISRGCKACMRLRTSSPEYKAKARERQRRRRAQQRVQVSV